MSTDYSLPCLSAENCLRLRVPLFDVRKSPARLTSGQAVVGSAWIDPFEFTHTHPLLSIDRQIAFFCVHGHEVSQFACALARLHGRDAVYVRGGFEALRKVGAPLEGIA